LRESIDDALCHAEAVITEGRNRVSDLRLADNDGDFARAIAEIASQHQKDNAPPISFTIEGLVRPLRPIVHDELVRIAQEAIRNSVQHANATHIEVAMQYGRDFQLSIRDDGKGLSAEILAAGSRPGHFGLIGIRERTERVGGKCTIVSLPGEGTEVYVTVPGPLAFAS